MGLRLYVHPDNVRRDMITSSVELTWEEKVVLTATRSLKSSYGGVKNFRYTEANHVTGITLKHWDEAKANLIERKLLNRAGAITNAGRNAIGDPQLRELKPDDETPKENKDDHIQ